ncbi:MAG: RNA polymerase sigma factor [Candidatus Cyclobacteriaceae bacterium M3_2C_046]
MASQLKVDFSRESNKAIRDQEGIGSDYELWHQFKQGHEEAFITIYNRFVEDLYQLGHQLTADSETIKDCLQDFFIELRTRRENLSDTDNIKLYLFKSFRRKIFHTLKKSKRLKFVSDQQEDDTFPAEFSADEKIINAQMDEFQLKQLNEALSKLPAKEREAIYYFFYKNMSYSEIAALYHYDHISSARRLIYKSLKKLRKFLFF